VDIAFIVDDKRTRLASGKIEIYSDLYDQEQAINLISTWPVPKTYPFCYSQNLGVELHNGPKADSIGSGDSDRAKMRS
jgi:hypothetical protein